MMTYWDVFYWHEKAIALAIALVVGFYALRFFFFLLTIPRIFGKARDCNRHWDSEEKYTKYVFLSQPFNTKVWRRVWKCFYIRVPVNAAIRWSRKDCEQNVIDRIVWENSNGSRPGRQADQYQ